MSRSAEPRTGDPPLQYDAFISYRRSDGTFHARLLRRRLQSFRLPPALAKRLGPQRPFSIFLDEIYETATDDFFERTIKPALRNSAHLIVLQTPDACALRTDGRLNWLVREVEYYRSLPQGGRISVALAKGTFDDRLPGDLHRFHENIDRVDIRDLGSLASRFSDDAIIPFIAKLRGVPQQEMPVLRREEEKRRAKRLWIAILSATAVLVSLTGLLVWALISASVARNRLRSLNEEHGRQELVQGRWQTASLFLSEAYSSGVPSPGLRLMLGNASGRLRGARALLDGDGTEILCGAFSEDSTRFAAGNRAGAVTVWDTESGQLIAGLPMQTGPIEDLLFNRDGTRLVYVEVEIKNEENELDYQTTFSRHAHLWKVLEESEIDSWAVGSEDNPRDSRLISAVPGQNQFMISPDPRESKNRRVIDFLTGEVLGEGPPASSDAPALPLPDGSPTRRADKLASTSDEAIAAQADSLGNVVLFDPAERRRIPVTEMLLEHAEIAYLGHTDRIVALARDGTIVHFGVDGTHVSTEPKGKAVALSPDGLTAVIEGPGEQALLVRTADQTTIRVLNPLDKKHRGQIRFSRNGRYVVLWSSPNSDKRCKVAILKVSNGKTVARDEAICGWEELVIVSNSGVRWLLERDTDKQTAGRGLDFSSTPHAYSGPTVVDFLADGCSTVTGLNNGSMVFSGSEVEVPAHRGSISGIDLSDDERWIATASEDGTAGLWDLKTQSLLRMFRGHEGPVRSVRLSHAGQFLLTGGDDGTARVWEASSGRELLRFPGHVDGVRSALFSASGRYFSTTDQTTVRIWALPRERRPATEVADEIERLLPICLDEEVAGYWRVPEHGSRGRECQAGTP